MFAVALLMMAHIMETASVAAMTQQAAHWQRRGKRRKRSQEEQVRRKITGIWKWEDAVPVVREMPHRPQ